MLEKEDPWNVSQDPWEDYYKKNPATPNDPFSISQADINIANKKGGHEHAWLDGHLGKLDDVEIEMTGREGDSEEMFMGADVMVDGKWRKLTDDEVMYIADTHDDWVYNHHWDNFY